MRNLNLIIQKWLKLHNSLLKKKEHTNDEVTNYRHNLELLMQELLHYIYFILLNRTSKNNAQDITSSVLLKIYKNLPKYKGTKIGEFKAWVYKITINTFSDFLRKNKRSKLLWFSELFNKKNGQDENVDSQEYYVFDISDNLQLTDTEKLQAEVQARKILKKLAPQDRDFLLMRFYYGMSYKEIADVLQIKESTARKRMQRLLKKIRG